MIWGKKMNKLFYELENEYNTERKNIIDFAKTAPVEFLNQGPKPMLIDEWQHISFILAKFSRIIYFNFYLIPYKINVLPFIN